MKRSLHILMAGLILLSATGSASAAETSFSGSGTGIVHPSYQCMPVIVDVCRDADGTARGTSIGSSTWSASITVPPPTYCTNFRFVMVIVAADHSSLTVNGQATVSGEHNTCETSETPIQFTFDGPFQVSGGTGRFSGATGEGTFTGVVTGTGSKSDERVDFSWSGSLRTT